MENPNLEPPVVAGFPNLKPVVAVQDEDCHWYVIPKELQNEFNTLLQDETDDEYEAFETKFGQYRTGGDLNLIALYAEV